MDAMDVDSAAVVPWTPPSSSDVDMVAGVGVVCKLPAQKTRPNDSSEKVPLMCSKCGAGPLKASEFLKSEEEPESWAGGHWGHCFECSGFEDKNKFRRAAGRAWASTTKHYRELAVRARSATWSSFEKRLTEEFPGIQKAKLRAVIKMRVAAAVQTFMADFEKENVATQTARLEVHKNYMSALESMANDPAHSEAVRARGLKFCAEEAAWLTRISEGVAVCFVCRSPKCRFYGRNDAWICGGGGNRFRCPLCGEEYWPWKDWKQNSSGNKVFEYLPFQKVVVLTCIDSRDWLIPTKWPGSQADTWLLQQAEVHAAKLERPGDMEKYMEDTMQGILELCERTGSPCGFRHFPWQKSVEWMLNGDRFPRDGERGWGRLVDTGFDGDILPEPADGQWEGFEHFHDIIQLVGQAMFCRMNMPKL
jgi:hypothetical protein